MFPQQGRQQVIDLILAKWAELGGDMRLYLLLEDWDDDDELDYDDVIALGTSLGRMDVIFEDGTTAISPNNFTDLIGDEVDYTNTHMSESQTLYGWAGLSTGSAPHHLWSIFRFPVPITLPPGVGIKFTPFYRIALLGWNYE